MFACALLRLPGLLLATEHYGDAPVRIEIAERWAQAPHLFRGFTEAYQYGPLHLTLLGLALRLWPDRFLAPRLVSFMAGILAVGLLWRLARRATSPAGALLACAGLALDPVHLQVSTSGASEGVFLALLLGAVELIFVSRALPRIGPDARPGARSCALGGAALLLGAAGLVRYDGWLYLALIGLWLLREALLLPDLRSKLRALLEASATVALAALPALGWLWINRAATGDPLAPIHYINLDHRALADMGVRWMGSLHYRLYCLVFWPLCVLLLSSPLLGFLSLWGAARALLRRSPGWELAALAWIPAGYFTLRGALLADFRPMARFVLVAAALSLPFAWDALVELELRLAKPLGPSIAGRTRRALLALSLVVLIATPAALLAASWNRNGAGAEWARPLSPLSSVPPGIAESARWLRDHARPDDVLLLDGVWDYLDLPLAFATGLPESRLVRQRYDNFADRLRQTPPTLAVLLYQGNLRWLPGAHDATEDSARFDFRGTSFCREKRFVYASVYRRCTPAP